jgi:hypothetical protein
VLAPRPAAGPALAFLQFLLRSPNAPRPGSVLLGILDPTDELVAGQGRDVLPGIERRSVGDQRRTEVRGKLMHHPTGHSLAAHEPMLASRGEPLADTRLCAACWCRGEPRGPGCVETVIARVTAPRMACEAVSVSSERTHESRPQTWALGSRCDVVGKVSVRRPLAATGIVELEPASRDHLTKDVGLGRLTFSVGLDRVVLVGGHPARIAQLPRGASGARRAHVASWATRHRRAAQRPRRPPAPLTSSGGRNEMHAVVLTVTLEDRPAAEAGRPGLMSQSRACRALWPDVGSQVARQSAANVSER